MITIQTTIQSLSSYFTQLSLFFSTILSILLWRRGCRKYTHFPTYIYRSFLPFIVAVFFYFFLLLSFLQWQQRNSDFISFFIEPLYFSLREVYFHKLIPKLNCSRSFPLNVTLSLLLLFSFSFYSIFYLVFCIL